MGRKDRPKPGEPTEHTPKGYEVSVPKRGEFFSNLKKIARKDSAPGNSKK